MTDIWSPERLGPLGSVMERYAPHVETGFRLRRGMHGDPLYPFASPDDAPCGTVDQVFRGDDGLVRLVATMDDGETAEFTNRSTDQREVWEMEPSYMETFRRTLDQPHAADAVSAPPIDPSYRGEIETRFAELSERLDRLADNYSSFRSTMTDAVTALSKDVLHVSEGESADFSTLWNDQRQEGRYAAAQGVELHGDIPAASSSPPVSAVDDTGDAAGSAPDEDVSRGARASSRHEFESTRHKTEPTHQNYKGNATSRHNHQLPTQLVYRESQPLP